VARARRSAKKAQTSAPGAIPEVEALRREVASLRAAIALLHRIGHLVGAAVELGPTTYAILTGVTAGVGLRMNRAMLFLIEGSDRFRLRGAGAVGPSSQEEADRVWRSIEAESPDLDALYASGLRRWAERRDDGGTLDHRVRQTAIDLASDTPIGLALRRGELVIGEGRDDAGGLFHLPTAVAVPLRDRHEALGVLYADNRFTGRRIEPTAELVFSLIADDAARAIAAAQRWERLAGEARTDALTGLGHHGAFVSDLGREAAIARGAGRPLGLLMIDLDGFKQVNDRLGHPAGDALLAGVASRMRGVIRGGEGVYRYGGDEFAVLLPGASRAAAALIGGRILRAVGGQPVALGEGKIVPITCSIGVASLPEDATAEKELTEAADRALFRAKAGGKNAVA
jgi:diguanylate cyclase (GGDEF)-like protein